MITNHVNMLTRKRYRSKHFTSRLLREEKRWLSCSICIKYNLKNGNVYISPTFNWGSTNICLKYFNQKKKQKQVNIIKIITDDEARDRMKKIMKENPIISSKGISSKTGISNYRINRLYMSVKRSLL